jgi:hypothetical protein
MAWTSHMQNARNVTLYASYPPSLPQHLCDWRIYSAVGEVPEPDLVKYSQWFDGLPERIETFSILDNWGIQHLVMLLVTLILVWGLWCRTLRVRHADGERGSTVREWALGAGLASTGVLYADGKLMSCAAVVAICALWSGLVLDGLAISMGFFLVSNARMVAALGLSVAYSRWAALRSDVHRGAIRKLPSYREFLADLRPVEQTSKQTSTREADESEDETEHCLICWSSDELPQKLPCKGKHSICMKCLTRLHVAARNQCPFCRLSLYRDHVPRTALYEVLVACHGAMTTFDVISVALKIYQGSYIRAAVDIFSILLIRRITWESLEPARLADDSAIEELLEFWAVMSVIGACWTGYWTGDRDQATFVDGDLVRGLCMRTKYQFVWDQ